jgi:hypothetical protein
MYNFVTNHQRTPHLHLSAEKRTRITDASAPFREKGANKVKTVCDKNRQPSWAWLRNRLAQKLGFATTGHFGLISYKREDVRLQLSLFTSPLPPLRLFIPYPTMAPLIMYIHRRDDGTACPPGVASCSPSYAIGSSTQQQNDNTSGPIDYGKPGPHRFIGIFMVVGLIFLSLIAYCIIGRRPRELRRKYCRCLGGRKNEVMGKETSMKQVSVVLETHWSASYSSSDEKRRESRTSNNVAVAHPSMASRSKSRQKQSRRSRSQSIPGKPRSNHRSGDDVAKDIQDVNEKPGNPVTGWDVEHGQGVRYEVSSLPKSIFGSRLDRSILQVRTPKNDGTDEKVEVRLQKPCLAYQR